MMQAIMPAGTNNITRKTNILMNIFNQKPGFCNGR
jgi:hypothetical protein